MSDIPSLTNEKLRELAEPAADDPRGMFKRQKARERDAVLSVIKPVPPYPSVPIVAAKEEISRLEAKLASARAAHGKFPSGATFGREVEESSRKIGQTEGDLHWAKRHLADLERAEQSRDDRRALAGSSRLFEITAPDGRKMRQAAPDAAALEKRLQFGYQITAEVFAGGYVKPLGTPSQFDGWLEAHGEELVSYLAEKGFTIRPRQRRIIFHSYYW